MLKLFTAHPHEIGESYFQHLKNSSSFAFYMLAGGIAYLIHGIFPFLFVKTGSDKMFHVVKIYMTRAPANDERIARLSKVMKDKTVSPTVSTDLQSVTEH